MVLEFQWKILEFTFYKILIRYLILNKFVQVQFYFEHTEIIIQVVNTIVKLIFYLEKWSCYIE